MFLWNWEVNQVSVPNWMEVNKILKNLPVITSHVLCVKKQLWMAQEGLFRNINKSAPPKIGWLQSHSLPECQRMKTRLPHRLAGQKTHLLEAHKELERFRNHQMIWWFLQENTRQHHSHCSYKYKATLGGFLQPSFFSYFRRFNRGEVVCPGWSCEGPCLKRAAWYQPCWFPFYPCFIFYQIVYTISLMFVCCALASLSGIGVLPPTFSARVSFFNNSSASWWWISASSQASYSLPLRFASQRLRTMHNQLEHALEKHWLHWV